ncbi:hypothetical protein AB9E28_35430, partial [Rhizobium leguminosarum]
MADLQHDSLDVGRVLTDLRCAVIGKHPIVRIVTDEGLYGLGEVEFTKSYLKPFVLQMLRDHLVDDVVNTQARLVRNS